MNLSIVEPEERKKMYKKGVDYKDMSDRKQHTNFNLRKQRRKIFPKT